MACGRRGATRRRAAAPGIRTAGSAVLLPASMRHCAAGKLPRERTSSRSSLAPPLRPAEGWVRPAEPENVTRRWRRSATDARWNLANQSALCQRIVRRFCWSRFSNQSIQDMAVGSPYIFPIGRLQLGRLGGIPGAALRLRALLNRAATFRIKSAASGASIETSMPTRATGAAREADDTKKRIAPPINAPV